MISPNVAWAGSTSMGSPPRAIILMKVGFHGTEPLPQILERKTKEQAAAGAIFWGYGGTVCHPMRQIRPFVEQCNQLGVPILVLMSTTSSKFHSGSQLVTEFSEDGEVWKPVPTGVKITSSRYALVIRDLEACDVDLDLGLYRIALGPSAGKRLSEYVRGRVDKCVGVLASPNASSSHRIRISYSAQLAPPYAVVLR